VAFANLIRQLIEDATMLGPLSQHVLAYVTHFVHHGSYHGRERLASRVADADDMALLLSVIRPLATNGGIATDMKLYPVRVREAPSLERESVS
jgi:hypothetical protein